jgi:excisionase family DNA binding protein
MRTTEHKNAAAELGLEWSAVRAIYAELREFETAAIARTLEARKIAFAYLGVKHAGQFQFKNRHATTTGDATNVRGFDDIARELAAGEIPELGADDPAAALWDLVTAPAPVLPTADETMRKAIDKAAAEAPAAAVPAVGDVSDLVPLPEAAGLADVTEQWLRQLVKAGRLPAVRVGRCYLVSRSAAENFRRHPTMGRPRRVVPF